MTQEEQERFANSLKQFSDACAHASEVMHDLAVKAQHEFDELDKAIHIKMDEMTYGGMTNEMSDEINNDSPFWARKPKERMYNPCDLETVGKCPKCGNVVISTISHTDTNCGKCGLKLCWDK